MIKSALELNDSLLSADDDELLEKDLVIFKAIKERRLMAYALDRNVVEEIFKRLGLTHYLGHFLEYNPSMWAPYHNGYHSFCMVLNCYEAAYYEKLSGEELRALIVAALYHDYDHTAGKEADDINITRALAGMSIGHKLAKANLLSLTDREMELAKSYIRVTKYPYETSPQTTGEMIIRDADLMQLYEENAATLLRQYRGLKEEVERRMGKTFTDQEYAEGQYKWWKENVHWYTPWATRKAELLNLQGCMVSLRTLLLGT